MNPARFPGVSWGSPDPGRPSAGGECNERGGPDHDEQDDHHRAVPGLGLWVRTNGRNTWIVHRRVDAVSATDVSNWFDDLSATRAGSATR